MTDERVRAVVRRWPVVVAAVLVAVITALASANAGTGPLITSYRAQHLLYTGSQGGNVPGGVQLPTLALLATYGDVPANVVQRLNLPVPPAVLANRVQVAADTQLGTLTVTVTDTDPDQAVLLADTFAEEILAFARGRAAVQREQAIASANSQLASQEVRIAELEARLGQVIEGSAEAGLVRAERDGLIRQYGITLDQLTRLNDPAAAAGDLFTLQAATALPIEDSDFIAAPTGTTSRLTVATVVGLLLGVGIALALQRVDTKIRTRRDAEDAFELPILVEVPHLSHGVRRRGPVTIVHPASQAAEASRLLRMSLQLMPRWVVPQSMSTRDLDGQTQESMAVEGPVKLVLVTSAEPAQGKTTTAVDLAASFAELGLRVVIADCDFRHPGVHARMGTSLTPGVRDYEAAEAPGESDALAVLHETDVRGVWVAPAGMGISGIPSQLPTKAFLRDIRMHADIIIIDSGPLLTVNDAAGLIPHVDAVILVARSGRTSAEAAQRARELLARVEAPLLGVALTDVPRTLLTQRASSRYYQNVVPKPAKSSRNGSAAPKVGTPQVSTQEGRWSNDRGTSSK